MESSTNSPLKRKAQDSLTVVKKPKFESLPQRCSSLPHPIMILEGHLAEIYSCRFNSQGNLFATASFDKTILLWNTANWVNFGLLRGHSNAILDLDLLPDGNHLLSASADKSIIYWDTETGKAIKRYRAHSSYANTVSALKSHNGNMFVSGSDDSACKIWDLRSKACSTNFKCHYPVLSACFNLTGDQVFTAGLDNVIKVWDVRTESVLYSLEGHNDTVTGIKLSPDGDYLCSNSMDNTCKVWDVKPYSKMREYRNFFGHQHGLDRNLLRCAWSPIGNYVSCGSADHNVFVWNVEKNSIEYKLPGHKSGVNDIAFHPTEPILASAGSDKVVYLGEIEY